MYIGIKSKGRHIYIYNDKLFLSKIMLNVLVCLKWLLCLNFLNIWDIIWDALLEKGALKAF